MLRNLAAAILAAFSVTAAEAGEVADQVLADQVKSAEDLAGAGKFIEALDALDAAEALIWDRAPLSFRRALWVSQPPSTFGAFVPRETNEYVVGDEMYAYVEPIGFGWRKAGDKWQMDVSFDIAVKDKTNKEVYAQKDFQKLTVESHTRSREVMNRLTFILTGLAPGDYVLETTLRDAVSSKEGSFSLPFVIK